MKMQPKPRGLYRLAVEDRRAWAGLAPSAFAVGHDQTMMHAIPDALTSPAAQVVVDRLPRRKIVRQKPPSHAGTQEIQDRID